MRRDRQTGMTKLIVALRNFANAPKKADDGYLLWPKHVAVPKIINGIGVCVYIYPLSTMLVVLPL
jgi:hypothetical protein